MAERRMAEIVGERQRLGQVLVEAERAGERAGDLGHFQRVGEPGAVVVALVDTKTWVLCLRRRKAVAWMMRSRSRRNSLRVGLAGSACSRPRLAAGIGGIGRARAGASTAMISLSSRRDLTGSGTLTLAPRRLTHWTSALGKSPRNVRDGCERHSQRTGGAADRRDPQGRAGSAMLRVSVEGGGCSGFQYNFDIERAQADDDLVIERDGAVVLIDPVSLAYMAGSEIDFVDDLIGASFKVNNPNATASCGCGTSFSIYDLFRARQAQRRRGRCLAHKGPATARRSASPALEHGCFGARYSAATGARLLLDLLQLRLEPALQHAVEAVEIDIDHRRDVERQELRHASGRRPPRCRAADAAPRPRRRRARSAACRRSRRRSSS